VRIDVVEDISSLQADVSQAGTQWGTGGMVTKLTAARLASAAGCATVICKSDAPGAIQRALAGDKVGTLFKPVPNAAKGRKRWLLALPPRGEVWLDAGATMALKQRKSLFPSGVMKVSGQFAAQDAVRICDGDGRELARGLVNYSRAETDGLRGKRSREFPGVLGYTGVAELVHRGNICFTAVLPELASDGDADDGDGDDA
jgi:glutamate 5-kinase